MCWVQLAELLQVSVAVQKRSTPAWPVQLAVAVSLCVIVGLPPQLSVALAVPLLATLVDWPHCSCVSAGQLIAGARSEARRVGKEQLAGLLQLSVAVQMRSTTAWPVQLAVAVSLCVIVGLA